MNITFDVTILTRLLDTLQRLAPPTSGAIIVNYDGKKVLAKSASDLSQCTVKVPTESIGGKPVEFSIPLAALRDAIKGHKQLELSFANAALRIKGKGYEASLATVDVVPIDELEQVELKSWELSKEISEWLNAAAKQVALKPTTILSSWVPLGVKVGAKSAFVACYDSQRVCWTSSKEVTGDFECVAPADVFVAILDTFKGQSIKVETGRGRIRIMSKGATVVISTPVDDEMPALADVMSTVKESSSAKGVSSTVKKAALTHFFDNARSVVGKDRAEVVADKGLTIQSSVGKVTSKIDAGAFKIDYEFFVEAVTKSPKEDVELKVVKDSFLSIGTSSGSIIVAQNQ